MRQNASKCDDLRKRHLSLKCCDQRLCEPFGEGRILLPKLDVVGSNPIARFLNSIFQNNLASRNLPMNLCQVARKTVLPAFPLRGSWSPSLRNPLCNRNLLTQPAPHDVQFTSLDVIRWVAKFGPRLELLCFGICKQEATMGRSFAERFLRNRAFPRFCCDRHRSICSRLRKDEHVHSGQSKNVKNNGENPRHQYALAG